MKTTLGLFLGALLAFSLAGCDDGGSGGTGGTGGGSGGAGGGQGGNGGGQGGNGGGQGGAGGGQGGAGGGTTLSCGAYCDAVMTNCTGANQQYGDKATCEKVCAKFAVGTVDDKSGDSLGCRTYHGGAPAASMPGEHCPHAGPLGGAVCGTSDCKNFCSLVVSICGGQATPPYADATACEAACANFPGTGAVPYNNMAVAGDSLACRMYHLTVASTSDANGMTHCPHTMAVSDTCK